MDEIQKLKEANLDGYKMQQKMMGKIKKLQNVRIYIKGKQ